MTTITEEDRENKTENTNTKGRKEANINTVTSFEQLPVTLSAEQVASVLGISKANAYNLMRSEGFPTIRIGKRMIVPRDSLIDWMNSQINLAI